MVDSVINLENPSDAWQQFSRDPSVYSVKTTSVTHRYSKRRREKEEKIVCDPLRSRTHLRPKQCILDLIFCVHFIDVGACKWDNGLSFTFATTPGCSHPMTTRSLAEACVHTGTRTREQGSRRGKEESRGELRRGKLSSRQARSWCNRRPRRPSASMLPLIRELPFHHATAAHHAEAGKGGLKQ